MAEWEKIGENSPACKKCTFMQFSLDFYVPRNVSNFPSRADKKNHPEGHARIENPCQGCRKVRFPGRSENWVSGYTLR